MSEFIKITIFRNIYKTLHFFFFHLVVELLFFLSIGIYVSTTIKSFKDTPGKIWI